MLYLLRVRQQESTKEMYRDRWLQNAFFLSTDLFIYVSADVIIKIDTKEHQVLSEHLEGPPVQISLLLLVSYCR